MTPFQGVSCVVFLLYLQSTVVEVDRALHTQKGGVCSGSAVPPILSELFLNAEGALGKTYVDSD